MEKIDSKKWTKLEDCQSSYRKIISKIMNNNIKQLNINDVNQHGDITFSIKMTDIGLKANDYKIYEKEFFSHFIIDFIGELILRENINLFSEKFCQYSMNEYNDSIREFGIHKRFGVKAKSGILTFKFHISLLKQILIEDLRETIG